jgi:hypothetical protein
LVIHVEVTGLSGQATARATIQLSPMILMAGMVLDDLQ